MEPVSALIGSMLIAFGALMLRPPSISPKLLKAGAELEPDAQTSLVASMLKRGAGLRKWGGRSVAIGSSIIMFSLVSSYNTERVFTGVPSGTPSTPIGPPGTPTVSVTVSDTSTWYVTFSSFIQGEGGDTQDSIQSQVDRLGGNFSSPLTDVKAGVQIRDTLSDNTDWKADSTYVLRGRQKGASGGWSAWSAPDTFVNTTGPEIYASVDWSDELGTTTHAVMDSSGTTPFPYRAGQIGCGTFEVIPVSGSGLAFPTTNMLRQEAYNPSCGGVSGGWGELIFSGPSDGAHAAIPKMEVGDTVVFRYYRALHAISFLTGATTYHGDSFTTNSTGLAYYSYVSPFHIVLVAAGGHDFYQSAGPTLAQDTVYRIEHLWTRTASDSVMARTRIYKASDESLVADEDDFDNSLTTHRWVVLDAELNSAFRGFKLGTNGISGLTDSNDEIPWSSLAGFAVCSSWCGAYPASPLEN